MSDNSVRLSETFLQLQKQLTTYQSLQHRRLGPSGDPHRGQGRVLSILKLKPEISQKELGYLLDMRNQSLGELLQKLEKNGLVTRTASDEDRRSMTIRLTEAGAKLAEQTEKKQGDLSSIFDCLSAEEGTTLDSLLQLLLVELGEKIAGLENTEKEASAEKGARARRHGSEEAHQRQHKNPDRKENLS